VGVMDGLQGATNEQKKAALAALAQAGQKGLEAYQSGLSNVDQSQQQALGRTQNRGSYLGADAQGELSSIVGGAGDAARTALQRAMATYGADNAARQAATGAYFDQVSAAVPLAKQYGDNQIGIAKTKFEQERQREIEQQNWAREEHAQRMAALAAQQSAAGAAKDSYTDAQKLKIAQAMQSEQDRAALQQQMDDRLAALNREGQVWFDAQKKTANEQSLAGGGSGVTTTADRAERDSGKVINARQSLGWDSGSLDLMDPGRNPSAKAILNPGSLGLPGAVQMQFAQQRDAQEALRQQALAQLDALNAAMTPIRQKQDLLKQDDERVKSTRARSMDLFGDPGLAMLSANYTDPNQLYSSYLSGGSAEEKLNNKILTGYTSPAEQLSALKTQQGLQDYATEQTTDPLVIQLAKKVGATPEDVATLKSSDAYAQLFTTAVQSSQFPTMGTAQQAMFAMAAEMDPNSQQLVIQMIPLVLAEMEATGRLFANGYDGSGYDPRGDEG